VVTDPVTRVFYIASDGSDAESNHTLLAGDLDPTTGQIVGPGGGGGASNSGASGSTGVASGRRLLSLTDAEIAAELAQSYPVYRLNTFSNGNDTIELSFPAYASGLTIQASAFLFVDVYHGFQLSGQSGSNSYGVPQRWVGQSGRYTTVSADVDATVSDALGTAIGRIAFAILCGFAFLLLIYFIYLRCKYGGLAVGLERSLLSKASVERKVLSEEEREERRNRRRKREEQERNEGCCRKFAKSILLIFAFALLLVFETIKVRRQVEQKLIRDRISRHFGSNSCMHFSVAFASCFTSPPLFSSGAV
jgi:hypothetical protein